MDPTGSVLSHCSRLLAQADELKVRNRAAALARQLSSSADGALTEMQVGTFLDGLRFTLPAAGTWAAEFDAQRAVAPHDRWASEMAQARGGTWASEMGQVGQPVSVCPVCQIAVG
jgi:hypothetical protein